MAQRKLTQKINQPKKAYQKPHVTKVDLKRDEKIQGPRKTRVVQGERKAGKRGRTCGGHKGNDVSELNVPRDAVEEWPTPKQIHSYYFVSWRPYEDPTIKSKIGLLDKEIMKKNQARSQIAEAPKAKRMWRDNLKVGVGEKNENGMEKEERSTKDAHFHSKNVSTFGFVFSEEFCRELHMRRENFSLAHLSFVPWCVNHVFAAWEGRKTWFYCVFKAHAYFLEEWRTWNNKSTHFGGLLKYRESTRDSRWLSMEETSWRMVIKASVAIMKDRWLSMEETSWRMAIKASAAIMKDRFAKQASFGTTTRLNSLAKIKNERKKERFMRKNDGLPTQGFDNGGLFNTIPRPWHNSEKVWIYVTVKVSIETVERVDGGFHDQWCFETSKHSAPMMSNTTPVNEDGPMSAPLSVNAGCGQRRFLGRGPSFGLVSSLSEISNF
ncbi:hypothetical protein V8G54_011203 [Vigna mungo]|uniref:Uncharacterized protein n=1 Tax=Vigna mungo TaxID=3915 RepID=A0AAQ3S0Z9_VIGMU